MKIIPRACAGGCTDTSDFNCSITLSGMRATQPCIQSAWDRRARLASGSGAYFGPSNSKDPVPVSLLPPPLAGPAPKLLQQMERIQRLPKAQRRFVMQMIDTVLAQQDR